VTVDLSFLRHVSLFSWFGLMVSIAPLLAGVVYMVRPNEQALALMRPLSLAGIFASVSGGLLGFANGFEVIATTTGPDGAGALRPAAAEAMVLSFVGVACLTVAWFCVAAAIRRTA
jgi:hypothetical protein